MPLTPNEDVNVEILQVCRVPIEARGLQVRVVQAARNIRGNSLLLQPHMEVVKQGMILAGLGRMPG